MYMVNAFLHCSFKYFHILMFGLQSLNTWAEMEHSTAHSPNNETQLHRAHPVVAVVLLTLESPPLPGGKLLTILCFRRTLGSRLSVLSNSKDPLFYNIKFFCNISENMQYFHCHRKSFPCTVSQACCFLSSHH